MKRSVVRSPDVCPGDIRAVPGVLWWHQQDTSLLSGRISSRANVQKPETSFPRLVFVVVVVVFKLTFVEVSTDYKYTSNEFSTAKHL